MTLKIGQKVVVRKNLPFGQELYIEAAGDTFYLPNEASAYAGNVVTINHVNPWRKTSAGKVISYYRIYEDGGSFGWLEEWFTPINIKDAYLIQLKDGRFIVIPRDNLVDAVFVSSFESLADEVKENCTVFERQEKKSEKDEE